MENLDKVKVIGNFLKSKVGKRFKKQTTVYVDESVRIRESELGYLNSVSITKNKDIYLYFDDQLYANDNNLDEKGGSVNKILLEFSPNYVFDAEINTKGIALYHYNTKGEEGIIKTRWLFKTQYIIYSE